MEQLAEEAPHRFEDQALELLGYGERDDDLTAAMLEIAVNAGGGDGRGLEAYDVFLANWQPLRALKVSEENDERNDHLLVTALVRVVLAQEKRIAALEAQARR